MADPHADMEFKEKHEKKDRNDNGDENDWTEVPGGFVPHISSAPETTRGKSVTIPVVTTLADYKRVVVDEPNRITVVRFAAPWCRACKAVQPHFAKLALHYQQLQQQQSSTATTSSEKSDTMMVQFVECPVSKDTALLHQGLGVPSVPFGHIYHPTAGLVEEIKLNKKVFGTFCRVLETYVQGYCDVTYINDNHDHDGTAAAAGTTGSAELRVAPSPSRSQPDDEGFL
jgi:thiol-disulfide isomerase/thioredoxin